MLEINKYDFRYRIEKDGKLLMYNVITAKMYFFVGKTKQYLLNYTNPEQIPIQRFIPYSYKSGGRYLRKTDEQQYLDQQKAINKAVGELNNNIIKLFLKMMS